MRSQPKIYIWELSVFRWFIKTMRLDEMPLKINTEIEKSEDKVLGHSSV